MITDEIISELKALGTEQTRKTFANHGAPENCYGVKIGDLKKFLLKKVKNQQELCMQLFKTGNTDAQYLAGLGIDPQKMTKEDITLWLSQSSWTAIDETIVAGVAAESTFALELAREWLLSSDSSVQNVGWLTFGKYLSFRSDDQIPQEEVKQLLKRLKKEIHTAPNEIRYSMNQFIIYTGIYCSNLTKDALEAGKDIAEVEITLPTKGCRLPDPIAKIQKASASNRIGVKRKRIIC